MKPPALTTFAATTAFLVAGPAVAQNDFQSCLQTIRAEAMRQGVSASIADGAFRGLTPDQKVVDLDSRQPEFSLTYSRYVGSTVSNERIVKGQQRMAQHRGLLDAIQSEYGVPPQYIMAFWGIETNYGGFMGDFQVVRSVATLACMTKRRDFFSNETVQALRILGLNHMTREQMRGSWAGAMGNMQFMPSTFMRWGVDRDGNGRIDLWHSLPDAFASAGNFLRGIGWKPPLPAAEEVILPRGFPLDQADTTVEKPVRLGGDGRQEGGRRGAAGLGGAVLNHPAGGPSRAGLHPLSQLQGGDELEPLDALCAVGRHPGAADRGRPAGDAGAAGRRRAAVARHRHRHAEPAGPAHALHRRDRRSTRPQDALGRAALPEADRHARRRPSDAGVRPTPAAGGAVVAAGRR
jgi:lytic murein transglycosylase